MTKKTKGLLTVLFAYTLAIFLGAYSISFVTHLGDMWQILIADVVATFVIYGFSVAVSYTHLTLPTILLV